MWTFIIRRLLISIPLLIGITIISFLIINLAPGGQVALPGMEMNPGLNPKVREMIAKQFHFDRSLPVQYVLMMKDMVTGDLTSFKDQRSAIGKVLERLPATLALSVMAFLISTGGSLPLGIYASRHKGRWRDKVISVASFAMLSLPSFWVAYMLVLLIVRVLHIPALGLSTFGVDFQNGFREAVDVSWHVFMPAVVLALGGIAGESRYMRASMVEAMNEDYIRTARAKGLSESAVAYKHALRNSLRPIVTFVGYLLPAFLGGAVIIEQIFGYPGMGRLMYQALLERDMPVLMVELTIGSALLLVGNMIADVLYAVVDPRVRPN
ncbi:MAG: ABC transporter permease [Planctomycetaceae bacterium]|nr:ABC transporter permease [Planctomycetaceae bacterium]